MSTNDIQPAKHAPTTSGRQYATVKEMLLGERVSQETQEQFSELNSKTHVTRTLAKLRASHDMTQEEFGKKINLSQGAISKLEHGLDEDLRLGEIQAYSRILDERIGIGFGRPPQAVESIKFHALAMRTAMLKLAKLANEDAEIEKVVNSFFGEAFFNLLDIMGTCHQQMPHGVSGCAVSIEVQTPKKKSPSGTNPQIESHSQTLVPA